MVATGGGEAPRCAAYVGHAGAGAMGQRGAGRWRRRAGRGSVVALAAAGRCAAPVAAGGRRGAGGAASEPVARARSRRPSCAGEGDGMRGRRSRARRRGGAAEPRRRAAARDAGPRTAPRAGAPAAHRAARGAAPPTAAPRRLRRRPRPRPRRRHRPRPRSTRPSASSASSASARRVDVAMRRELGRVGTAAQAPASPRPPPRAFLRMSAICSSIQSPGSRDVTISFSPRARRARSSGDIVSAA